MTSNWGSLITEILVMCLSLTFLALAAGVLNTPRTNMTGGPNVVIIGAGVSGLAAASRLFRSGLTSVTVLEASDRIGGRIMSVPSFSSSPVGANLEFGAQWIHGKVGNVLYKLASDHGLVGHDEEDDNVAFVREDGKVLADKIVEKLGQVIEDAVEKAAEEKQQVGISVGSFFNAQMEAFLQSSSNQTLKSLMPLYVDYWRRMVGSVDGSSDWNELSLHGSYRLYEELPGSQLVSIKSSKKFEDILDIFATAIPPECIKLNSRVISIASEDVVRIQTENGANYEADVVIVTLPLGVLKAEAASLFKPPLNHITMEAIHIIGFGTVDKIYMEFSTEWWSPKFEDGVAFLFDHDLNDDDDWTRSVLAAYPLEDRPRVLCLWVAGEAAQKMETLSDQQIAKDALKLLRKFLGSKVKGFESIKVSKWHTNHLARGSYSYQTVESELKGLGPHVFSANNGHGDKVLFAGEATSPRHFSTVHGAIESGWREADKIIMTT